MKLILIFFCFYSTVCLGQQTDTIKIAPVYLSKIEYCYVDVFKDSIRSLFKEKKRTFSDTLGFIDFLEINAVELKNIPIQILRIRKCPYTYYYRVLDILKRKGLKFEQSILLSEN